MYKYVCNTQVIFASLMLILILALSVHHYRQPGWVVYLNNGCHFCHKQMDELKANGMSGAYVMYDRDGTLMADTRKNQAQPRLAFASIRGFPFWSNVSTGETKTGLQRGAALRALV